MWYRAGFITFLRNSIHVISDETSTEFGSNPLVMMVHSFIRKKTFCGCEHIIFHGKAFKGGFCDLMPTKSLSSSDVSTVDFC